MAQKVLHFQDLPKAPLDAAAHFHAAHVPEVRRLVQEGGAALDAIALVFPAAGKDQHGWRLAAVQELAREAAPVRINGVAGNEPAALDAMTDWLAQAEGITGQLLPADATGAGNSDI